MSITSNLLKGILNSVGWHSRRKFIIIESDDWGSRRTDSLDVYKKLCKINRQVEKDPYSRLDNIANAEDLNALFDLLLSIKDINGNHPVITANAIMANPDFDKIKTSGFQKYFYEPFHETIKRFSDGAEILDLWKQGQDANIFKPQLHGREHLQVLMWIKELKAGNKELLQAFDLNNYSVPYKSLFKNNRKNLQAAFDNFSITGEEEFQKKSIKEGADIFQRYFGYSSVSFIAPAYIWPKWIEKELAQHDIKLLQGLPIQYEPKKNGYKKRLHFIGQKNKFNQYYIHRNAFFEPSIVGKRNEQLAEVVQTADKIFKAGKPLIISIHRIQFIGSLNKKNRDENLLSLKTLLETLQKNHPEIEFISSDKYYEVMMEYYSKINSNSGKRNNE